MTVLEEYVVAPPVGDPGPTWTSPPWQGAHLPFNAGVKQYDRIFGKTGADVPGSLTDPNRPANSLSVHLNPYHSATLDFSVKTTVAALAADKTITLADVTGSGGVSLVNLDFFQRDSNGEMFRVQGTPVGNQVTVIRGLQGHASATDIAVGETFTVIRGDICDSGGSYATSRAEVYTDLSTSTTPAPSWPIAYKTEKWFNFGFMVEADHVFSSSWMTIMQLKGRFDESDNGGSPPIAIEIANDKIRFGGERYNQFPNSGDTVTITKQKWYDITYGVFLDYDSQYGWFEGWVNGVNVFKRRAVATMNIRDNGTADPVYPKQGIYRSSGWQTPVTMHYKPVRVASTSQDFGINVPVVDPGTGKGEYWGGIG